MKLRLSVVVGVFSTIVLAVGLKAQAAIHFRPDDLLTPRQAWSLQAVETVDVLDYILSSVTAQSIEENYGSYPAYNRAADFGGWIRSEPGNCQDTRAKVLIRDLDDPATLRLSADGCKVRTGEWVDPYTDEVYDAVHQVQIDHVVPLKHAWYTGAANWTHGKRCHYANFLSNSFHLLAVSGRENMSKGDRGPEGYLPPSDKFQCKYLTAWMAIKTIWKLSSTQEEADAIQKSLEAHNCGPESRTFAAADIYAQQQDTETDLPGCN